MYLLEILFFLGIFIIFYSYLGYGILLWLILKIRKVLRPDQRTIDPAYYPSVSFVVPCYNEADIIEAKINDSLQLDYPADKLQIIFITDGSDDGTPELVRKYDQVQLLHQAGREGKSAAENRVMQHVQSEITVFSDANTYLPSDALKKIVRHYADASVGAVSGEKRIMESREAAASSAGEGLYWKYESALKRMDSELYSIVGAAGELISFRTALYEPLEKDTILDDFVLSLRIAEQGYRVIYEPGAYAMETASANIREELKRKVRICAGGWQAMLRLQSLLNPFRNFVLTFQYVSHRVLRWSVTPLFLFLLIPVNAVLVMHPVRGGIYMQLFILQLVFYAMAMLGLGLARKAIRVKLLYIPFYFFIMNYSVILGFLRFVKGKQKAAWERAKRG